ARMSFEQDGGTYMCTGTLLNTRNSSNIPYFLTANHCISTEAVAHTLETMWFYQKDRCNGVLPNSFPRSVGAALMATGDPLHGDFTLLRLNSVPNGVTFQGWDPNEKPLGTPVTTVHHPEADYKRISFGKLVAGSTLPAQIFYAVEFTAGVTE